MSLVKPFFDFTDLFRFHSNEFLQNCRWSIWTFCYAASMQQHTIRKFKFLSKNSILTKKTPIFSRVFHPNFFWHFFSRNQSCKQLKSPKPQHFHEFFSPKNRQFSREIKVEFLTKNENFEQCAKMRMKCTFEKVCNEKSIFFSYLL